MPTSRILQEGELEGNDEDWTGAAGAGEFMVSRSRPSVSYRKTVRT